MGQDHPRMPWKSALERMWMTPDSVSASDIITIGPNQMSASQARPSLSSSSQVTTRQSRMAEMPASATIVLLTPGHGDVTHPPITARKIRERVVSRRLMGPICASSSAACARAAWVSRTSGG